MVLPLFGRAKRDFSSLSEPEMLALAISSEEDDSRIYKAYAAHLRGDFPDSAKIFDDMAEVEDSHRRMLIDMFKRRFGDDIPLVRREHVRGFLERRPDWLMKTLSLEKIRRQAVLMEEQAQRFYRAAMNQVSDADTRKLLGDLAIAE
ncbi:MAG: ferritin family protein, partial [Martelella sp.]